MPSRNVLKIDIPHSYYHLYARGASRKPIFLEHDDFLYFLSLFQRYLSSEKLVNSAGVAYKKLHEDIELVSYCLMGNHFHLLVYQKLEGGMQQLMRSVMVSYSRYFNSKYQRSGSLFETRYKASRVSSDEYLMHVSRYIHLNPKDWEVYPYSSIAYVRHETSPEWVHGEHVTRLFSSPDAYIEFIRDYEDIHDIYESLKHELAN